MSNVVALPTRSLSLALQITDAEVIHELEQRDEGAARQVYATHALRLGVLALRQASGSLDAEAIRREGQQLLTLLGTKLEERSTQLSTDLATTMQQYLDPASGALTTRLDRLTQPNGELDALLAKHLDGDQSLIARALARHIGEQSPIFKLLSPTQSDGLMAVLTDTLKKALEVQRGEVLQQFSLDRKDSALSRLLAEVSDSNGKLRVGLAEDVGKVVKEFSLDNEEGALSRLVSRIEQTQATISEELSLDFEGSAMQRLSGLLEKTSEAVETSLTLDDETSPLSRLKQEILGVLKQHRETSLQFQTEMRSTLEMFKVRREEADRSTRHGLAFEDSLGEQLTLEAQRAGDIYERVGTTSGRSQRKLGDFVVELGPDSASAGARIVFEAKAKKSCTLKNALSELSEARENREAQVGVFVFDRDSAPDKLDSLHRIGSDVFVVWDADDATTDIYLHAAYGLARTLAHRECAAQTQDEANFVALDTVIKAIAKHAETLGDVETSARTVRKQGDKILSSAQAMRDALERELEELRKHVAAVRADA